MTRSDTPYCIAFDTKDMAPRIKAVRVDLSTYIMRDMDEKVRVDLCDHPLYPALERYVLANPSGEGTHQA
ncbi:MAG: hypothetical protein WCZ28_06170 [Burkholderiaceae bacterium]